MNEKNEKSKFPSISEFLDIYPPIIKNQNNINDTKKFFVYFDPIKNKSQKNIEKIKNIKQGITSNLYPILLEKILKQQKNKSERTQELKDAIKNFLLHSDLIVKLNSYFSNQQDNGENNLGNLEEQIDTAIDKLSENIILEKYDKNKRLINYGEYGHDCYFLLSGKISVLKPVEYSGINISYHDYLKYLSNLLKNKEKNLILKIIEINNKSFFQFHNLEEIKQDLNKLKLFIKSYCIKLLELKLQSDIIECTDIPKIIKELKEFNLTLKDLNLDQKEIEDNINQINKENIENEKDKFSSDRELKKYILKIFSPSEDDKFNMKPYESLLLTNNDIDKNTNNDNNLAILYKYDLFLYSYPGSFFGEMALEKRSSNKKRNATIRTEEECFVFSLTQKLYNYILVSSINLIKEYDIAFLQKNYFFNEISNKNFDKFYYPMFKVLTREKNDIIHKQYDLINSIYFLKEGKIKLEISLSIVDIYNLIRYFILYLSENKRLFNLTDEEIYELNNNYLDHNNELYFGNKPPIFRDKINEIKKYELYDVTNNEAIGLLEFMSSQGRYNTSYVVLSKNAKLFEINKKNLEIIIKRETDIKNDFYKFAKNKFLIMIKRLHSIKFNCLSNIFYKIKQNFFGELSENNNNNYIKNEQNNDDEKNNTEEEDDDDEEKEKYKNDYNSKDFNVNEFKTTNINNNVNINSNKYENILTSPKNILVKIKKIKLPLTNRTNCHQIDYNKLKTSNSHYSEFSFRSIKFNENYFIKNRLNNISKIKENNSNKSKFNASSFSFINTLLSPDSKTNLFEQKQNKLKLKKIKNRSSNLISIGKNTFFTLEQLKSKFKKKSLDKRMFDLSIVRIENKKIKISPLLNYETAKFNSFIFQKKNHLSPNYYHNRKFKKIIFMHNDNSNNNLTDTISTLNLAIKSCVNDIIKIKK